MIRAKSSMDQTSDIHDKINRVKDSAAEEAAEVLASLIRVNIRTGYFEVLGGERWEPRADDYAERVGDGSGMVVSGELLRSVTVTEVSKGKFDVTVDDPKAVWLEYGGFTVRKDGTKVPARPFFRPAVHYFEEHKIAETILKEKGLER